ncbi:CopD family protein [Altibacter sp.]|uniref:CopD family protein n=1 Tax=Altibacter sp. TaxID=2024823 RepID=UPI000C8EDC16|nr:CopD family protein [Altibacter sp.]MAP55144.1 protoporphyrinogen IX oxidase [Altibacter sp.]|tara:strand:+ start:755 stop:1303 length:549 start_codon:yes stop_codon:yes gene_type:complete
MEYNYIKSLHLIFVITWFAGLFYIVRLFVYQIEAFHKVSPEKEILGKQFKIMAKRLWTIITWPSMILALGFGIWVIALRPFYLTDAWMQVKLGFVIALIFYHVKCHSIYKELQNDKVRYSSNFMRLFNEGATIILFAVVFLVILKNAVNWIYGVVGLMLFSLLLMLGYRFYKRWRERNENSE